MLLLCSYSPCSQPKPGYGGGDPGYTMRNLSHCISSFQASLGVCFTVTLKCVFHSCFSGKLQNEIGNCILVVKYLQDCPLLVTPCFPYSFPLTPYFVYLLHSPTASTYCSYHARNNLSACLDLTLKIM